MKKITLILLAVFLSFFLKAQDIADSTVLHSQVVVTGTRNAVEVKYLPLTVTRISNSELYKNYNLSLIPAVTQFSPGVFSTSRGIVGYGVSTNAAGDIKVRGVGGGAKFLVLIDGQPQYAGLMGHPIPDVYQWFMADNVEIVRGPSSVLYGSNAMGGVMNIVTRNVLNDNAVRTNFLISGGSYGTFQAEGSTMINRGKFSMALGVNYQRTDGHRQNSDFEQYTDFIKLGYDINKNWKVSADLNLTYFEFSNPGPEDAPLFDSHAEISRGLTSVSLSNNYGEKTSGVLRFFYDWGHHEINDGHLWSQPLKDYLYKHDDFIRGVNWYQSVSLFSGNRITLGFDYQNFGGEAFNDFFDGHSVDLVSDKNQNEVAGYVDFRQEITKWLTADFGFRADSHSEAGTQMIPQFGLSFYTLKNDNFKVLVSKGFRNPTIMELYMFAPKNSELEPEKMMNYEVAYSKIMRRLRFETNLFYIKGDNLINVVPRIDGAGMIRQNTGEFENYGFELGVKYALNPNLLFVFNYSYLNMDKPVTGAPENKFFFMADYVSNKKFSSSISLQYVSGLYILTGNDPKTESYALLNANLGYSLFRCLSLFVKGENLLGQKYQTYEGFYMPKATFMGGIKIYIAPRQRATSFFH